MRAAWIGSFLLFIVLAAGAIVLARHTLEADPVQTDICLDALPALLDAGETAEVTGVYSLGDAAPGVILQYDERSAGDDGRRPEDLICIFEGRGLDPAASMLGDVRTRVGGLNQAQLYFLKRFWLADGVSVKEARQRTVSFAPSFRRSLAGEVPEDLGFFLQQIVNAAAPAILYGLLALAYGLVYGLTNRINLAFGDMATLGAFAALSGAAFATRVGLGDGVVMVAMAALVAAVSASVWGALFGAKVALPLIARAPQVLLIATTGAGIAIQEFLARAQGSGDHWLSPVMTERFLLADGPFPVEITAMQMLIVTGGFGLALMTLAAMRVSAFGRKWRAASDDGLMSEMLGINVRGLVVVTFALSTALAGVAGAIFTLHYGATSFHMGTMIGLKALVGAIVGGIGSPAGAFLGGIAVGLIETLWSAYHGLVWREVVILALLAIFLILRPEGLFGRRD